ncbi:hypothetical protein AB9X41_22055 [Ralstonia solanacearum]
MNALFGDKAKRPPVGTPPSRPPSLGLAIETGEQIVEGAACCLIEMT